MKIPTISKIRKQVDEYIRKNYSSEKFYEMFPSYKELEKELSSIHEKYKYIRDFCDNNRKDEYHSSCLCKNHPDYTKFVEECYPFECEIEKINSQWRIILSKEKNLYESMLLKARNAKLKYVD